MRTETDFNYDKAAFNNGLVICIMPHVNGKVSYCYARRDHAGRQIAWTHYANGERLPVHAVKYMDGDSFEALGRIKTAAATRQAQSYEAKPETRFADAEF